MINRRSNWRRFQPFAALLFALSSAALSAEEPLSAERVIAESQETIKASESDEAWASVTLAAAQAYLGNLEAAWTTLGPPERGDTLVWSGYLSVAQAEIELFGKYTALPKEVLDESPDIRSFSFAKAYAKRGDGEAAIELLSEIPVPGFVTTQTAAKDLVPLLLAAGQRDAARKALELQSKCYPTAWSTMVSSAGAEDLVRRLVELEDKQAAHAFCRHWEGLLQTATDVKDMGRYIGQTWAKLGYCYWLAGDKAAAKHALQEAGFWLEQALQMQGEMKAIDLINDVDALAGIAGRQRFVLGDDIARGTCQRAYDFADRLVSTKYGYWGYVSIVQRLLEVDDLGGARLAIERVQSPLDRAKCHLALAEYFASHEMPRESTVAARDGFFELKKQRPHASDSDTAMRLAKCLALAKEPAAAREVSRYAKELSALEENDYHSMIARWEIQAGLYPDAHATIRSIADPARRTLPLAELARELAKKEAFAKRAETPLPP